MLKAKIFYVFLFLIVVETTGLLLLKRGLEMGYLDTGAIILAIFSFAFYNLCSFVWVYFTIKNKQTYFQSEPLKKRIFLHLLRKCVIRILRKSDSFLSQQQRKSPSSASAEALFAWLRITSGPVALNHRLSYLAKRRKLKKLVPIIMVM